MMEAPVTNVFQLLFFWVQASVEILQPTHSLMLPAQHLLCFPIHCPQLLPGDSRPEATLQ